MNSKQRYKLAKKLGEQDFYDNKPLDPPACFDERQIRTYKKAYLFVKNRSEFLEGVFNDLAGVYGVVRNG
ncbi:hypothetical protein [Photobacterium damselae]|uniref:hypothetical protein n=1 Tax=Photobacterium damselae TaxID=38293 RepID=UPI004068402C